uniref:Uncharacterized protein n=1 Tax=Oryza sativa subsp. japonica TaxID=39947 RepID=Q6AU81_ORYSJ|nr:hypothetical protein [Oryza sativa Japonica Group]
MPAECVGHRVSLSVYLSHVHLGEAAQQFEDLLHIGQVQ